MLHSYFEAAPITTFGGTISLPSASGLLPYCTSVLQGQDISVHRVIIRSLIHLGFK